MMRARFLTFAAIALVPLAAQAQTSGVPPSSPAAQQPPAQPPAQQPAAGDTLTSHPWVGWVDFGARATDVDGDSARYERYRDLGDGLFLDAARISGMQNGWLMQVDAQHLARRDQRYVAELLRPGKVEAQVTWDQIPMLLSRSTRTLYSGVGSAALAIDDALQLQGQTQPSSLTDFFKQSAVPFDTRTRRFIANGAFEYLATPALTLTANLRRTDRSGTIPFGGAFGHSSLVEIPAPTEHSLGEIDAAAEYAVDRFLFRGGYTGSFFHNDVTTVEFDNPFRAADIASASSRGRLSLSPSNSYIAVNGMASVRLPRRSRATAYVSIGKLQDAGDPLMPQTINAANVTAPLPRSTVDGEARVSSVNLNFVSRPVRNVDFNVRYRTYEYDSQTPEFLLPQRVAYDNAPSALNPPLAAEQFSVLRHTFDLDAQWRPLSFGTAGIGFSQIVEDRTHRIFESTTDNVLRLSFDTFDFRWFTLRTKYEYARRRGDGIEEGEQELAAIGEQPLLRHFDVASRNRNRVTIIGSLTPLQFLNTSLMIAFGKDDYIESVFGLRDNTNRVIGLGADVAFTDRVTGGVSFTHESYDALNRSRQANPGAQFNDPSRNWAADTTDRTNTFTLNADIARIADKVDLGLSYDFSRGRAHYRYIPGPVLDRTLPEEVVVPTTLPTPVDLPETLSQIQRATVDAMYPLSRRVAVGLSWWHERYRVRDFTLDIDANPDLVRGQAILMGYLYRPYTANTIWGRLIVGF